MRFYGASDDVVVLHRGERAVEEFDCIGGLLVLRVEDEDGHGGCELTFAYEASEDGDGEATWHVKVGMIDEDVPIPWPIRLTARTGYSVVVEIDAPDDTRVDVVAVGAPEVW